MGRSTTVTPSISSGSSRARSSPRRGRAAVGTAGILGLGILLAGCADWMGTPPPLPPKDNGGGEVITAAPDAGGVLSFRNCPTLAEATAAMPAITGGPDANGVAFKSMVLQCSYTVPGRDVRGNELGMTILVFDAAFESLAVWHWQVGSEFGERAPVAGLGDTAFLTVGDGERHVWVDAGRFGLHLMGSSQLVEAEVVALAKAAVEGLKRPPR